MRITHLGVRGDTSICTLHEIDANQNHSSLKVSETTSDWPVNGTRENESVDWIFQSLCNFTMIR